MFDILLESRAKPPRPIGGAVVSTIAHTAIVLALVVGSRQVVQDLIDDHGTALFFLYPPDRVSTPLTEHIRLAAVATPLGGDRVPVPVERQSTGTPHDPAPPQGVRTNADRTALPTLEEAARANNAFSEIDVDSAAVRDPSSAGPSYPVVMMEKGIEGYATMRFVVDTTGLIDLSTVRTVDATHEEFVKAVRAAMPYMRFHPAKMGTHPVRQLAEQMFKFEIRRVASGQGGSSNKKP